MTSDDRKMMGTGVTLEQALADLREKQARGKTHGPGKAGALVVVDMQRHFVRDGDEVGRVALAANRRLLDAARRAGFPVYLIRNVFNTPADINPCWVARSGGAASSLLRDNPMSELHPGLGRVATDIVVDKPHASAFTGSSLHEQLSARGIDTLLVTGTTTSGCVRATAVDGAGRHYRVLVVEDCVFDHRPISGPVALSDMADRYADIISLDAALAIVDGAAARGEAA